MPGNQRKRGDEELDETSWSEGDGLSGIDKQKIDLAMDRFWSKRGMRKGGGDFDFGGKGKRVGKKRRARRKRDE